MSLADKYYQELVRDCIDNGYSDEGENIRPKWKDGTPAYTRSILGRTLRFDNSELAMHTQKYVYAVTAVNELVFWMWRDKSNIVDDLRRINGREKTVWNEWEKQDGSIGPAYGYQLGQECRWVHKDKVDPAHLDPRKDYQMAGDFYHLDQVDALIQGLIHSPSSRRHVTNVWIPEDLDAMALTPCVYETQWHIKKGKLHLEVRCRSNDMGLGHPFNIVQYNVLQRMVAHVLDLELGEYIFHIGDCHIYERHIPALEEQLLLPEYKAPELWLNPDVKNFYDFGKGDFKFIGYKENSGPYIQMEVAI